MTRLLSTRGLLLVLTLAMLLSVAENFVMILTLRDANRNLRAIRDTSHQINEDLQHVKGDVEDNAESLDYITQLLEERTGSNK